LPLAKSEVGMRAIGATGEVRNPYCRLTAYRLTD
jgi:hypothetical protein